MLKAVNLKTEYLKNPLGIDIEKPRFGWNLQGDGKRQTAFEIRAAHSEADLAVGNYVWQSGIVRSESMLHHPYGGTLKSRERGMDANLPQRRGNPPGTGASPRGSRRGF